MLRTTLLTMTLLLTATLWAQEVPAKAFTFDHVALSVTDVDESAEFYEAVFGLKEITNRTEVEGVRWFSLGESKELHLISIVDGPIVINQAVHIALTTPNFDRFFTTIEALDVKYSSWLGTAREVTVRADGTRQLYLRDPDGYWIEINSVASD